MGGGHTGKGGNLWVAAIRVRVEDVGVAVIRARGADILGGGWTGKGEDIFGWRLHRQG